MNYRFISFLAACTMAAVSLAMLASAGVSFLLHEPVRQSAVFLIYACGLFFVTGTAAMLLRPRTEQDKTVGMREGFAIVSFSWICATVCGMIPYIAVCGLCWYDALFESASGFSTTGATILGPGLPLIGGGKLPTGIEDLPAGILLWRSLTQWLGGMGFVILSLAILPLMKIGGQTLYNAEVSGIKSMETKIVPRFADSAKILWGVYCLLTLIQTILLRIAGMNWFDSVCHALTTLASGGFSTKQDSLAYWSGNPWVQWIMIVFMFAAGCNFVLHYRFICRKSGQYLKNEEFRFYAALVVMASVVCAVSLIWIGSVPDAIGGNPAVDYRQHPFYAFQTALFQVVSIATTSGFTTVNYDVWPGIACLFITILMFTTACGGSTAGGIKCVRIQILGKYAVSEIKRCLFPHLVQDIRISRTRYENATIQKTIGFCALYAIMVFLFAILVAALNPSIHSDTAFYASLSALSNIGPGFGAIGPAETFAWLSIPSKVLLAFEMILGRLELYTILVLFLPSFWKK